MTELPTGHRPPAAADQPLFRGPLPGEPQGILFVLSGPSGVGKDSVLRALRAEGFPLRFVVTVTTRPQRPGEVHGRDYFFVSPAEFQRLKDQGRLLEWAVVHGHEYGTPLDQVQSALLAGQDVLLKIDVQGAAQVKRRVPGAVFIFLAPPSLEDLAARLIQRGTESPAALARRLADARLELQRLPEYDYVVVNRAGALETAVAHLKAIITAERLRVQPRRSRL